MNTTITRNIGILMLVIIFSCCFLGQRAQSVQNQTASETEPKVPEPRSSEGLGEAAGETKKSRAETNFVKTADFYLRDGKLAFGKLISDDKNKITIEQIDEGKIVVSTYSKREVDTRTLRFKNVLEYKYYIELAEYFSGRTWDFRDDPDDFIEAIRCYEKAKQLISEAQDSEKIGQINDKLKGLEEDRKVWIRETTSRAELKKLEFEAEFENRLKGLEGRINAANQRLDKNITDAKEDYQKLGNSISAMNKDTLQQLNGLKEQVRSNTIMIARIDDYLRWNPWPSPLPQQPKSE